MDDFHLRKQFYLMKKVIILSRQNHYNSFFSSFPYIFKFFQPSKIQLRAQFGLNKSLGDIRITKIQVIFLKKIIKQTDEQLTFFMRQYNKLFHQQNQFSYMNIIYLLAQIFAFYAFHIDEGDVTKRQDFYQPTRFKGGVAHQHKFFMFYRVENPKSIDPWDMGKANYRMIPSQQRITSAGYTLQSQSEINQNVGKNFWNLIDRIFRYTDQKISNFLQILPGVQATDIGQIAYFEGDCPDGWDEYTYATGSIIITAGDYSSVAEDGRTGTATYNQGSTGGVIKHTLTIQEMPSHDRFTHHPSWINNNGLAQGVGTGVSNGVTGMAGGGQAHNNIPPYIVLKACIKIADIDLSEFVTISYLNLDIYAKQSTLDGLNLNGLQASLVNVHSDLNNLDSFQLNLQTKQHQFLEDQNDLQQNLISYANLQKNQETLIKAELSSLNQKNPTQAQDIENLNEQLRTLTLQVLNNYISKDDLERDIAELNKRTQTLAAELVELNKSMETHKVNIYRIRDLQINHEKELEKLKLNISAQIKAIDDLTESGKRSYAMAVSGLVLSIISLIWSGINIIQERHQGVAKDTRTDIFGQ